MKIVLATPLYPPDVAESAAYVKELAARLRNKYTVTIVAYGRLPEKIEGVDIIAVDKRRPLPIRLLAYTLNLLKAVGAADVLYVENGASVELPAAFVSLLTSTPLILHIGDQRAHEWAKHAILLRYIEALVMWRAKKVIIESPVTRPEILPFKPYPEGAFETYERSWKTHLEMLNGILYHGR